MNTRKPASAQEEQTYTQRPVQPSTSSDEHSASLPVHQQSRDPSLSQANAHSSVDVQGTLPQPQHSVAGQQDDSLADLRQRLLSKQDERGSTAQLPASSGHRPFSAERQTVDHRPSSGGTLSGSNKYGSPELIARVEQLEKDLASANTSLSEARAAREKQAEEIEAANQHKRELEENLAKVSTEKTEVQVQRGIGFL